MKEEKRRKGYIPYLASGTLVLLVSVLCFFFSELIDYKIVALLLLLTVSVLAILFEILPVLMAAVLSALVLNFLFIPPVSTLHIRTAEDLLLFCMYFIIALVNAVLTYRIRKAEKKAREKEERENTIRLYNTLFSSLSHELKTPVSTIIGAVDTLRDGADRLTVKQRDGLLSEIDLAGSRLHTQVQNLLDMTRLESGFLSLRKDWCDVNELMFSVLRKLSVESGAHRIEFAGNEDLPLFLLDSGLLEQALYNILHNALQYTPMGSVIEIQVNRPAERCVIVIADNGPGFPEEERDRVFTKFYRLPGSAAGGTGLGLSIARGFTEAHGGTISLWNRPGGGAVFTIEIPAEVSYLNKLKHE